MSNFIQLRISIIAMVVLPIAAETALVYPWITNTELFTSKVIINNLGSEMATVRLEAIRPLGNTPQTEIAVLTIDPLAQTVLSSAELFPGLGLGSGYMVLLTSDLDQISGSAVVYGTGSHSGSSPAQADVIDLAAAHDTILFNYLSAGAEHDASAPVILNPGDQDATVSFCAYQNGQLAGYAKRVLPATHPFAETTTSLFPHLQGDLYLVASSDQAIMGIAFIFNALLEPAMSNVTAINEVPAASDRPYVDTFLAGGVAMDGFIMDNQGNIIAAGGYLRDDVLMISKDGQVSTLVTGLNGPVHMAKRPTGEIYVSSFNDGTIKSITPSGDVDLFAQGLDAPVGMAFDGNGDMVVCEYGGTAPGNTLSRITPNGDISQFANDPLLNTPIDILARPNGEFYVANQVGGRIMNVDAAGNVTLIGQIPGNLGHMVYLDGLLYATGGNFIYQMDLAGQVRVFAGTGQSSEQDGPLEVADFRTPNGIAVGPDQKTLFIASATRGVSNSTIRRIYLSL